MPGIGHQDQPLWALAIPIIDRLLVVYHDESMLESLYQVLSSKVNTQVINLSDCENYFHTQIDNSVCLDWTVRHRRLFQKENPQWPEIQELQRYTLNCLLILIITQQICDIDPKKLIEMHLDNHWALTAKSMPILSWHENLPRGMMSDINHRIGSLTQQQLAFKKSVHEICYWSKTTQDLEQLLNTPGSFTEIQGIFLKKYHGWITNNMA